jgi:threonyl-tRNA synthetase
MQRCGTPTVWRAQVEAEVTQFLRMLGEVYDVFGLQYSLALSTRPEGYLGELPQWEQAEKALEDALNKTGATTSTAHNCACVCGLLCAPATAHPALGWSLCR